MSNILPMKVKEVVEIAVLDINTHYNTIVILALVLEQTDQSS